MFSKARLDAQSDGIFGVAMTLLILDVRLQDDFHSADGGESPCELTTGSARPPCRRRSA
jgi:hypothetical protein